MSNNIEKEFLKLASKWKKETFAISSSTEIVNNESYQKIIQMGEPVLPFIFKDLKNTKSHWFYALQLITGQNPIPEAIRGNISAMATCWLQWAEKNGY